MTVAICWFRRNLRVDDNPPLSVALRLAEEVVPVFVLGPTDDAARAASPSESFLAGSLAELERSLRGLGSRVVVRKGPPEVALPRLVQETGADAVVAPADHEPSGKRSESAVADSLRARGVRLHLVRELQLVDSGTLVSAAGKPFSVYTPFARRWREADKPAPVPAPGAVRTPAATLRDSFPSRSLSALTRTDTGRSPNWPVAGEKEGRRLWSAFLHGSLGSYAEERDRPDRPGTSRLSPHLRAGTIGLRRLFAEAREAYRESRPEGRKSIDAFVGELAWREFYAGLLERLPHLASQSLRPEFERFPWVSGGLEEERLERWRRGETGYPFVDAGMRQLAREGWMHNRVRMVVASFLTKDLLVHWRRGESEFRALLADGDVASNAGGWQWAAGTGTDAQPFFRVFNPVLQGERFDPDGIYVRRYVPELAAWRGPGCHIHAPWRSGVPVDGYPGPVVDHRAARAQALAAFSAVRSLVPRG